MPMSEHEQASAIHKLLDDLVDELNNPHFQQTVRDCLAALYFLLQAALLIIRR